MARKGDEAKNKIIEKIKEAFGQNFVGIQDKKLYIVQQENGESLQFAISITMPKTGIETTTVQSIAVDSFSLGTEKEVIVSQPTLANSHEMREKEQETVRKLMSELGL